MTNNVGKSVWNTNPEDFHLDTLRRRRKMLHLTLEQMAEKIEVDVSWLSRIERGMGKPGPSKAKTVAEHYLLSKEETEKWFQYTLGFTVGLPWDLRERNSEANPPPQDIKDIRILLIHMSNTLANYVSNLGRKTVIYRISPFEFSRTVLPDATSEKNAELAIALKSYRRALGRIISEGTSKEGDWWSRSIYGRVSNPKIDETTIREIDNFYHSSWDPGLPNNSLLAVNPTINDSGMLLIGELDLEKMKRRGKISNVGNLQPEVKKWHYCYSFTIDTSYDGIQLDNTCITDDENFIKAMANQFYDKEGSRATKKWELVETMSYEEKDKILEEIKKILLPREDCE